MATGPFRLSIVLTIVAHPIFLAESTNPAVTREAKGCEPEKTS